MVGFDDHIASIVDHCVAMRMRLMTRIVTSLYDARLRPYGLRVTQLNILVAVTRMGEAPPGRLGRILAFDKSTLSRNLDRMRRRGWIETLPGPNARSQRVRLTPHGRRTLQEAIAGWNQAQRDIAGLLGPRGVEAVTRLTDLVQAAAFRG